MPNEGTTLEFDEIIEFYRGEAIVDQPIIELKSGKEASVWLCSAGTRVREGRARRSRIDGEESGPEGPHPEPSGAEYVAVKVYKDLDRRSFRDVNSYMDGRFGVTIRKRRDILHIKASPEAMQSVWVDAEWGALNMMRDARMPVPAPYQRTDSSLAMEFVAATAGSAEPAPRLRDASFDRDTARVLLDDLLGFVWEALARDAIHGDLSAYNVLLRDGRAVVIDLPQFVDARYHSRAYEMLVRDLDNVCGFLSKAGAEPPESPGEMAREL
jgi:RIO kinase 1